MKDPADALVSELTDELEAMCRRIAREELAHSDLLELPQAQYALSRHEPYVAIDAALSEEVQERCASASFHRKDLPSKRIRRSSDQRRKRVQCTVSKQADGSESLCAGRGNEAEPLGNHSAYRKHRQRDTRAARTQ